MPRHNYIYVPSCETWPSGSVNARIPPITVGGGEFKLASLWLDQNKPVEQMTWAPGLPMIIKDRLISQGGWIERNNVSCFNLYRPPAIGLPNPAQAEMWIEHGRKIFPDEIDLSFSGWRTACNNRKTRSIMLSCSAGRRASARIPCSNQ
jgi:hypothetical protein